MATKRTRAAYESDPSPTVYYGTPLPPLDPDARDDGSYVPLWKQEATDERGRKRFHGAFTGGFSAGYFNSVGSKEGWTPAAFVSSRGKRAKDQDKAAGQRPEDFMDEEDLNEREEARRLQTAGAYAGLGSTADDARRRDALMDLMRPAASIGVALLQKMGWREGQGIGPKVRRRARLGGEDADDGQEAHMFAPQNTKMITFVLKTDTKGLGFGGPSSTAKVSQDGQHDDDAGLLAQSKSRFGQQSKSKKSSFGLGVLNDTGSDDEDPYEVGPKISYNKSLAARKKNKKTKPASTANPLVSTKPIFLSKKKLPTGFRKTHDGRLPLDGFLLTSKPLDLATAAKYPPPKVPDGWKSAKAGSAQEPAAGKKPYRTPADAARASTLDPAARASLLGEAPLPGKSVFDVRPAAARARLVAATGKTDRPAARGEAAPSAPPSGGGGGARGRGAAPLLDGPTARAALARLAPGGGWSPYADDAGKRARYRAFLEAAAAAPEPSPPPPAAASGGGGARVRAGRARLPAHVRRHGAALHALVLGVGRVAVRGRERGAVGPRGGGGADGHVRRDDAGGARVGAHPARVEARRGAAAGGRGRGRAGGGRRRRSCGCGGGVEWRGVACGSDRARGGRREDGARSDECCWRE